MTVLDKVRQYMGRRPHVVMGERNEPEAAGSGPTEGLDRLSAEQVLMHLKTLKHADLVKLGDYERSHQSRPAVLRQVDALLGHEPWPGYDALDVDGVRFGLDGGSRERLAAVLAYEREHKNRPEIVLAAQQQRARGPA